MGNSCRGLNRLMNFRAAKPFRPNCKGHLRSKKDRAARIKGSIFFNILIGKRQIKIVANSKENII